MTISPPPAWTTMLRATSEIAVATSVASVREKPSFAASARPSARAFTMSASASMAMRASSPILVHSLHTAFENRNALFEVERSVEGLEVELELHHRDGDVRLDAHDHRLGAAQLRRQRDRLERPCDKGIDHVQRCDVDDDAARAEPADLVGELVAQLEHLAVRKRRLDRRDQVP